MDRRSIWKSASSLCDHIVGIQVLVILVQIGMTSILNVQKITSLLNVVVTAKESVHLFETNTSGFWNAVTSVRTYFTLLVTGMTYKNQTKMTRIKFIPLMC